ncbi:MAG: DUF3048 domain-containing protein [Actinomycetia bacterium]|nr:DUF3048 domain-containing protein [Actinomycetes bacterium]
MGLTKNQKIAIVLGVLVLAALAAGMLYALSRVGEDEIVDSTTSSDKVDQVYYWPLTHEEAPDGEVIKRRPISMKIDNHPDARPQTGLPSADIVYETEVEGGLTRFHVLFQSDLPTAAGPMRSARLSDTWVVSQWDSYLLYSGAADDVLAILKSSGIEMIEEQVNDPRVWERVNWRIAPHNLYIHVNAVPDVIAEYGVNLNSWPIRTLDFEEEAVTEAPNIAKINVPFGTSSCSWEWDEATYMFKRFQDGAAHTDLVSGEQVMAHNVVILWTNYSDFHSGGLASLFKDGVRIDGTWSTAPGQPPTLIDATGQPITFKEGKTWFEVVPLDTPVDVVAL